MSLVEGSLTAVAQTNVAQTNIIGEMLLVEKKLSELGYWIGPVDGEYDERTRFAIVAFQKKEGLEVTGVFTSADLRLLQSANKIKPKSVGETHVEVDVSKQLLYLVDREGNVSHILPVATGTEKWFTEGGRTRHAITPLGAFTVRRKIAGWRKSPLGQMYYPSYIVGGVAIHGSRFVPNHPSTYGCVAVPLFAAERLSELMPIGTLVVIFS